MMRRPTQQIMLSIPNNTRYLLLLVLFALALSSTPAFPSARDTLQELYPDMSFGVLRFACLSDLPKGTVLKADEVAIHESILLQMVEKESPEFREEMKKNLVYVLEQEMNNKLLLAEAYQNGYPKEFPEDQIIPIFKKSKIPALSVSDEDTKAFYEKNSEALGNLSFDLLDLEKRFSGKMNIVFVHVHHFPFLASRYRINSIPVQVFFDKTGKEVFRHVGFYPQTEIEKKLAEMGVT
jgi:thioredoxin-related protein